MASNISIQLYTIRNALNADLAGSLKRLAEIGYRWIEPFQKAYEGKSAAEFASILSSLDMRISSSHANITQLKENLSGIIDYLRAINCPHLVCSMAKYQNEEEVLGAAAYFNEVGRKCRDAGMAFSYHNHNHEFVSYSGRYVLDILLEKTEPDLVGLELDVYWAAKAEVNPASFQDKWKDRSILLHCKDMTRAPEKDFAAVGEGILDFPAIIQAAPHVEWFVVEQDESDEPFRSVEASFRNLTKLLKNR